MRTLIVTTDKGTKSFEAVYAVATKEASNLLARILDNRPLSQVAADFEGIKMLKVDDDDFSLYNELTKVNRSSRLEVSLVLRVSSIPHKEANTNGKDSSKSLV